jgi:hypothetical protein
VTSYFPRGRERVKRKEISMNFATETATATAAKNNTTIWPGITSAPSARPLSLVLNMSPDICDPVSHSASAPRGPRSTLHTDTGDRPYKCQHCGDQFARRSVLPPSSISRRPTHLQFAYFAPLFLLRKRSPLEARQQMPSQRETSSFFYSFSPQGHLFYQQGHHLEASL